MERPHDWPSAILVTTRTSSTRKRSQLRTHPHVDREWLRRRDRTVVEKHVRYRDRDRRLRIEEGAESRELAIEQVVYEPVNLHLLGELVRAVQVRDPVVGELGVLVGVVANEPLATDPDDVGAEFQLRRDPVIDATFDLMPRNAGDLLAWNDEDISICVRERIVRRRQLSRELVGGIDEGVIGIHEILAGLVLRARLQSLAAGGGHVLEHAAALKHARDLYDVVLAVDAKQSELPVAATAGRVDVAAQSGLARTSDDLLKRRIRYQKTFQQARLQRIGAAELERRRYTVRFRISGIERHQLRENLVSQARHWIEAGVGITCAEVGAGAEQIGHVDGGEVVTAPRCQRQTVGQIERFVEIGAVIGLPRPEADRTEADIGGGVDDLSGSRDRAIGTDEEIRVDDTELAVGPEPDLAAIDAGADHEVVVVTEHLVVVEALQRGARRQRLGEGAVDGAPRRGRAGIATTRRTIDRLAILIEDLEGGRRRSRLREGIVF